MSKTVTKIEFEYAGQSVVMRKGFNCWQSKIDGITIRINGRHSAAARTRIEKLIDEAEEYADQQDEENFENPIGMRAETQEV
jgi:hypothetical protein